MKQIIILIVNVVFAISFSNISFAGGHEVYGPYPITLKDYSGDKMNLSFVNNTFDGNGSRLINNELISLVKDITSSRDYLRYLNKIEYDKLIKYIEIQKKVLEKYQKSGNYDSSKIVKSSIILMEEFKANFDKWFKNESEY